MNKLQLVRLGILESSEIESLSAEIHHTLQDPTEKTTLRNRNFRGTLGRYSRSTELAAENLSHAAHLDRLGGSGFTGFAISAGETLLPGLVTIIEDLDVRRQLLPLPPVLTRRLGALSFANGVSDENDNVAGWVAGKLDFSSHPDLKPPITIEEIYWLAGAEADKSGKGLWTFEPNNLAATVVDIENAGFVTSSEGWYDDGESRWTPAPKGTLLLRHASE